MNQTNLGEFLKFIYSAQPGFVSASPEEDLTREPIFPGQEISGLSLSNKVSVGSAEKPSSLKKKKSSSPSSLNEDKLGKKSKRALIEEFILNNSSAPTLDVANKFSVTVQYVNQIKRLLAKKVSD